LAAIDAGIAVLLKGHYPYVPHLSHWLDLRAREKGIEFTWEDYVRWGEQWVGVADAVLLLGHSPGADRELAEARRLGKRVFFSLADIPDIRDLGLSHSGRIEPAANTEEP
jgi:hypothetical protein